MCADVFSGLLKASVQNKSVHGVKVSHSAPSISHLFFADDSLLFARASSTEEGIIMFILEKYQDVLG